MSTKTKLFSASLILAASLMTAGIAQAQVEKTNDGKPAATMNQCWGAIANQMGGAGIMGTHSSAHSPFTSQPRKGVANQSRFLEETGRIEEGDPKYGGNGFHAIANGQLVATIDPVTGEDSGLDPMTCDRAE
jgi:hypothetical protein